MKYFTVYPVQSIQFFIFIFFVTPKHFIFTFAIEIKIIWI